MEIYSHQPKSNNSVCRIFRNLPKSVNRWIGIFLVTIVLTSTTSVWADPQPPIPGNWTLKFNETFEGSNALNGNRWRLGTHHSGTVGAGGINPKNISISGGKLKIKATTEDIKYSAKNYSYSTGELSTFRTFAQRYGYFEARIRYPAVKGLWPAFWLMPDRGTYGERDDYMRSYLKFNLSSSGIYTFNSA